ncbi:MAG: L-threonine 3-dehydrogenase [Chlamydiales bacterium]|nr:L-threonine 3-dehydrogenase [Chlamydiales bacterium]
MKALVKKHAAPGLWLEDVPEPTIGDTDVLIKIKKAAICGTDVHIYQWDEWAERTIKTPMVIGHEFVGEIAKVGSLVKELKVGDRVSGEGHLVCGHCRNCRSGKKHLCPHTMGLGVNRPGCFAEYLSFPAENVVVVPSSISDDQASFLDPLGNAVHTALSFSLIGEDVLITGAGPLGLMAVAIAKFAGARNVVITDMNEYRLDLAKKMGATAAVNIQKENLRSVMTSLGIKYGFDVILEMSGSSKALSSAIDVAFHGACIVLLGILPKHNSDIDWHQVIFKCLNIKGIYGREMFGTWYKMIAMLQSGLNIAPVITHKVPLSEFQIGFDAMLSGTCGKVILEIS